MTGGGRNRGIDALRGVAVLLVVLLHLHIRLPGVGAGWPARLRWAVFTDGYEAVFVFFAVSGFLICGNALRRHGTLGRLDARAFVVRRAGRIGPLLCGLLAVLSGLAWLGVAGYRIEAPGTSLGGAVLAVLTCRMNAYLAFAGPLPAGWGVLWSLSIEEAFYLGFPVLCLVARWREGAVVGVLVLLVAAMPWLRPDAAAHGEVWAEKSYGPGMAAIASGVVAAVAARRWRPGKRTARGIAAAGLAMLAAGFGWEDRLVPVLGVGGGLAVFAWGAALLCLGTDAAPLPDRAARWLRPLEAVGRRSYEVYLCHMFVVLGALRLFGDAWGGWACVAAAVPGAVALGWVVGRWVGDPADRAVRGWGPFRRATLRDARSGLPG